MAIFHLSAKVVSRGKGQSAVAKAAYNSRERIEQELTGQVNDFSRKSGLVFSGIFAPKDAPEWAHDRAQLWNEVERFEKRKDAQLAREVEISLPHELTDLQRRQLVTDFVREQFMRKGMVAAVAIHAPDRQGDDRNHHAHILLTMRSIGQEGFGEKVREWNSREQLEKWREGWERTANRYLERHGHETQIDRRTLAAQGIEREPTQHRGVHAEGMERRGFETERGNIYCDTQRQNVELRALKAELREVENQIGDMARGVGKLFEIGALAVLKSLEVIGNMFSPPREMTPGEIVQKKEDAEHQKIDQCVSEPMTSTPARLWQRSKSKSRPSGKRAITKSSTSANGNDDKPGRWRNPPAGTKTQNRRQEKQGSPHSCPREMKIKLWQLEYEFGREVPRPLFQCCYLS